MKDSWDKVFRSLLWELQVPRGRWNAKMRGSLFHSSFFVFICGLPDTGQPSLLPTQTALLWYNKDNKGSVAAIP